MDTANVVAIGVAIIGAITGATGTYISLRKNAREEQDSAVDAWRSLLDPIQQRLDKVEDECLRQSQLIEEQEVKIEVLERENERLRSVARLLVALLKANGISLPVGIDVD